MITKLTLTNFKQHENLVVDFTGGLIALKGANEAGKSTIYHAIVYAFFGARALPLTLAETVTYDKPETSLKVELVFTFEGVTYTITRSKSGAVMTNGTVTSNGQAEVTKAVEKLFGINADAATKLMVASQNGLRGALETGEAVPLIEKLANIDLIDQLIAKIQAQLPCGNTKQIVEAIEAISKTERPVLNTEDLEPAVEFTKAALTLAEAELMELISQDDIDGPAQQRIIDHITRLELRREQIWKELDSVADRLTAPPEVPSINIETAKQGLEDYRQHTAARKAYVQFLARPTSIATAENFQALWESNEDWLEATTAAILKEKLVISAAKASMITESACGLCGKDLTDVPEVVTKNAATQAKITEAEGKIAKLTIDLEGYQTERKELAALKEVDQKVHNLYTNIQKYVEIAQNTVPATLTWIGDIPEHQDVWPDYATEIREGERLQREYDRALAVYTELQKQHTKLVEELGTLIFDTHHKKAAQELLNKKMRLVEATGAKRIEVNAANIAHIAAKNSLSQVQQRYEVEMEGYTKAMDSKAGLEASLAAMVKHNALIKKLRDVRPVVAARLWNIVLSSVSTFFSGTRGTPSVVTRSSTSFAVGGRPVGGLSGSTLDALGLAIRMALGKTFLPSIDFMLLDEPAAGMDEERETAMLGLLASTGYNQIVVVTHSSLADTFATSVIQL